MSSKPLQLVPLILLLIITRCYSQKLDAAVIRYISIVEAAKDYFTQTDSVIIQINNRAGDQYAEISIPYSKTEKVSNLEAWIETVEGYKIRELKKNQISERSAISEISLYEDHYNKCFELKHNSYPYRLVYTYTTTCRDFITYTSWSPIINLSIPTFNAKLILTIPKDIPFIRFGNNVPDPEIDTNTSKTVVTWNTWYFNPAKTEIYSQPEISRPYVIVAPLNFEYGAKGSLRNWESFGNWYFRLIEGLDVLPESEKEVITKLILGTTEKKEIVKLIYHYLQDHTRYISVSIGIGGYKPYPASYVALNKYGDCKALTNYLKTLLSFAGIESFYTLVYASEQNHDLIKNFAGPQFNHVVLAVPLGNDTLWLESTSKINPFNYWGTFTQNREALLIKKENSHLVKIPALRREENLVANKLICDFQKDGNARLTMTSSFRGYKFEMFNQFHTSYNHEEKERLIRDYMPYNNYEVISWELKKQNRDTASIELNATLNLYKLLKPLGNEFYLNLFPCIIPPFTTPSIRTLPVKLPYPIFNIDTLVYNLPVGYMMKTGLDTVRITTEFGNYNRVIEALGDKIMVIRRFELHSGSYTLEQYPDFYTFIKSVKEVDEKKLIIKPIY